MIDQLRDKTQPAREDEPSEALPSLPYRVELWGEDGLGVERLLARAANARLARLIFRAAQREHPGRRVTLCRGGRRIADTAM